MLLTITATSTAGLSATDLGFLLHKNPARVQSFDLSFGRAHVFYPEASPERCTAALLLDLDPVGLVRRPGEAALAQYVSDRPYVASSFLSVAIGQVYGSALVGRSRERADLVERALPLQATIAVLPCRGGEGLLRRLFEPLGYTVEARRHPLDERFPEWGESPYFTVVLRAETRLRDLLAHLYVLVPVLDDEKHYWVGEDEVEKLLRHGEGGSSAGGAASSPGGGWLAAHPERDLIVRRYLKRRRGLVDAALARLSDDAPDPDAAKEARDDEEQTVERPIGLHEQRIGAVVAALRASGARRVLDLGCGEGRLLQALLADRSFVEIVGVDVSHRALDIAADRLHLDRLPPAQRERITLLHGALTYRGKRLAGYDAAAVVEVVEHLDPPRLAAFERVLFEQARPTTIVLTTPNREYNAKFPTLPAGHLRHRDHRFEWTRAEMQSWAEGAAARFGYAVRFQGIGPEDPDLGAPSQMAVFTRG